MTSTQIEAQESNDERPPRDFEARIESCRALLNAGATAIDEEVDVVLGDIQAALLADGIEERAQAA